MLTYEEKYNNETYLKYGMPKKGYSLKPNALSTNRYDDVARLILYITERISDGKVLDAGCGQGLLLMALEKNFFKLYGIDPSSVAIDHANAFLEKNVEKYHKIKFIHIKDEYENLPFEDEFFDVLLSVSSLEHIRDIYFALKQYNRVLKSGGYIIVTVPNIAYMKYRLRLLFGQLPVTGGPYKGRFDAVNWEKYGWDGGHYHYFTKKTLDLLLKYAGFLPIKWSGDGKLAKLRRWWPSLLTGGLNTLARKLSSYGKNKFEK